MHETLIADHLLIEGVLNGEISPPHQVPEKVLLEALSSMKSSIEQLHWLLSSIINAMQVEHSGAFFPRRVMPFTGRQAPPVVTKGGGTGTRATARRLKRR